MTEISRPRYSAFDGQTDIFVDNGLVPGGLFDVGVGRGATTSKCQFFRLVGIETEQSLPPRDLVRPTRQGDVSHLHSPFFHFRQPKLVFLVLKALSVFEDI